MNKLAYFDRPILDISKTLMYEFWYDYIKPKYQDNAKLCYMDTDSFVIHIRTEDFYEDVANNVKIWFDQSNYSEYDDRTLLRGMNKKEIRFFKDELGRKIMKEFLAFRPKTYSYLIDQESKHKKAKGTKECVINRRLQFNNYKDGLLNNKILIKSQQRFKSEKHKVYTQKVDKIALSSNDNKRLQTFDRTTTYPYGTNAFKVCENEMLSKNK